MIDTSEISHTIESSRPTALENSIVTNKPITTFRNFSQALFRNHPDRHPIVILKDVSYVDMRSLLEFMYRGEVSVEQERLTVFLHIAEMLRIKGLTEVSEEKSDEGHNASAQGQHK